MRTDIFYFMRKQPVNVLRYLPAFLAKDPNFKNVQDALSIEHERYRLKVVDIAKQFFVDTATWGLKDWEEFLKITPTKMDDTELRRNMIRMKILGGMMMNKENFQKLLEYFLISGTTGFEELGDNHIKIEYTNANFYWDELLNNLWELTPAHLIFEFQFNAEIEHIINYSQFLIDASKIDYDISITNDHADKLFVSTHEVDTGVNKYELDTHNLINSKNEIYAGTIELQGGLINFELDPSEMELAEDDYTEFERFCRERWKKFKQNPVITFYKHGSHSIYDDEFDEDDPDHPEVFPEGDFLRLYFSFPYNRIRYLTFKNPRLTIRGREINYISRMSYDSGFLLNSRGLSTTGIKRALLITKTEEKLF